MDGSQQRPTLIGVEQQKMVVGEGGRVFRKQKPRPKLGFYNLDCEYGEGGRRAHRWSGQREKRWHSCDLSKAHLPRLAVGTVGAGWAASEGVTGGVRGSV